MLATEGMRRCSDTVARSPSRFQRHATLPAVYRGGYARPSKSPGRRAHPSPPPLVISRQPRLQRQRPPNAQLHAARSIARSLGCARGTGPPEVGGGGGAASHAPGQLGAGGGGEAVGAGDEPGADGRGVGEGAGDRAAAGGDAGDAARPPRVRVRALAHRPRREGRGRRSRRARAAGRGEGAAGPGRAVGVRQAGGEAGAAGVRASADGQRERGRDQLPQQQRRRPAQLLHAAIAHQELHRAAAQPDAVHLRRPDPQCRLRVQQEGEGPGRRDRQVLVVAVGSAVAQVQPSGPGRAARRVRHARRVGRHPESGQALNRFTGQSLSSGPVSAPSIFFFLLQACSSVHICFVCDIVIRFV